MRRFVFASVVVSSVVMLGRCSVAASAVGNGAEFFAARGITFYASFEKSLTADYSAGRSDPINPKWRPLYPQQKIAFGPGKTGNCASARRSSASGRS